MRSGEDLLKRHAPMLLIVHRAPGNGAEMAALPAEEEHQMFDSDRDPSWARRCPARNTLARPRRCVGELEALRRREQA